MLGLAFVASVESSAAGEPGHGSLDGPSVSSESLGTLDAFTGDAVTDASAGEPLPQVAVVVALVGVKLAGLAPAPAAA